MRAREYRIGNYVRVRGVIQFIIGIDSNNDWNVEDGFGAFETIRTNVNPMNMSKHGLLYVSEAEPIPLTGDALLGFGFVSFWKDFIKDGIILHNRKRGFVVNKKIPIIKYVHQLQNLYHALCGKELTTKNDTI